MNGDADSTRRRRLSDALDEHLGRETKASRASLVELLFLIDRRAYDRGWQARDKGASRAASRRRVVQQKGAA